MVSPHAPANPYRYLAHLDAAYCYADSATDAMKQASSRWQTVGVEVPSLRARVERLTVVFRRLFWVAAAGLALTGVAVVCGDWESRPGWWVGMAGVGQAWMVVAALWALRVYRQMETLEKAAQAC